MSELDHSTTMLRCGAPWSDQMATMLIECVRREGRPGHNLIIDVRWPDPGGTAPVAVLVLALRIARQRGFALAIRSGPRVHAMASVARLSRAIADSRALTPVADGPD